MSLPWLRVDPRGASSCMWVTATGTRPKRVSMRPGRRRAVREAFWLFLGGGRGAGRLRLDPRSPSAGRRRRRRGGRRARRGVVSAVECSAWRSSRRLPTSVSGHGAPWSAARKATTGPGATPRSQARRASTRRRRRRSPRAVRLCILQLFCRPVCPSPPLRDVRRGDPRPRHAARRR